MTSGSEGQIGNASGRIKSEMRNRLARIVERLPEGSTNHWRLTSEAVREAQRALGILSDDKTVAKMGHPSFVVG
jgi:hypothetical protein